jgi:2-polyprenyl-6-methoxyphenol hydroxylase-like FAD-dependent oxidoreductase
VDDETEVLIVGAGPVGLALALELQRFGVRFKIIEKKEERSKTSKALGLQPRVSEVFGILGIKAEFDRRGFGDIRAVNFHSGARKLLRVAVQQPVDQAGREACQPRLLIIPQSETEEILEHTLEGRGDRVDRRSELAGFEQDRNRVRARIRLADGTEQTMAAQFLVSCEGAHSVVRKQAGFSFAGTTMPMRFLLADVTIDWDCPADEVQVWFYRDGVLGALPFGAQKWRLIIECAAEASAEPEEVTLSLIQRIATERIAANIGIRDPVWLSDFRINARIVDRFRDRRVFVAGDAAHIHSPLGGQGIATGIQDASNLAKIAAVLRDGAPDSLLDTYEEERKPVARAVLRGTTVASRLAFAMNPILRFIRERILFPILGTEFVQRRLLQKVSQLELSYHSSLAELSSGHSLIGAGDRAPDVLFRNEGRNISLFELLGKFGLLALLGLAENNQRTLDLLHAVNIRGFVVSPGRDLEDLFSDFGRLYGVQGSFLYLIRPDGHVGLFQKKADPVSLGQYLKKIRTIEGVEKAFG